MSHPQFLVHSSQNPWNFLSDESKGLFSFLSSIPTKVSGKMISGYHSRIEDCLPGEPYD